MLHHPYSVENELYVGIVKYSKKYSSFVLHSICLQVKGVPCSLLSIISYSIWLLTGVVDSKFLHYLAQGDRDKKDMSGLIKKKKGLKFLKQNNDKKSREKRLEEGKKAIKRIEKEMRNHDRQVVAERNAHLVTYMQDIVNSMSVPLHKDEFEDKLNQLEKLIEKVASRLTKRKKGEDQVESGDESSEDEKEPETTEPTTDADATEVVDGYNREQRALFDELHTH